MMIVRSLVRGAFQVRKQARIGTRRAWKRATLLARRVGAELGLLNVFYSPPGELRACPACGSRGLEQLDVMPHYVRGGPREVALVTGCRACGIVFANPMPDRDALAAFYAADAEYAHDFQQRETTRGRADRQDLHKDALGGDVRAKLALLFSSVRAHLDVMHPPAGAKVLDYGCGPGRLLDKLRVLGWETSGIEPAVKSAFPRHRELEAPPEEPTFLLVTVHHVLEHLPNPLEVLRSLSRAMVEGGVMYISVPRLDTLPLHRDFHYCINPRGHITAYSPACLATLLAMAGLTVIEVKDDSALDEALTQGEPRRLRVFARKSAVTPPLIADPLADARRAFQAYRAAAGGADGVPALPLPARLRASWLQRRRRRTMLANQRQR